MTMTDGSFAREPNKAKACFDSIYTEPDPREYHRVLGGLNYVIPDLAKDIFRQLIAALEQLRGRPIKVLDLGCSYGNNAALIRFPLEFARLQQRYMALQSRDISTSELLSLDHHFFQSWPRQDLTIVGCDVSRPAVAYARAVGLIDDGITQDLEQEPLIQANKNALQGVDLIISTGAIGYVTERTLSRLLRAIGEPAPWLAAFVLRMFPYDTISGVLDEYGHVTEKASGVTFVQRRFQSEQEFLSVLSQLEALGIDSRNKEMDGLLHSELFLSRPPEDCDELPIEGLASVSSGICLPYGPRFRLGDDHIVRLSP
ncbi:class I SAM-dependent methyltransferase [Hyphomicrobium sp. CS1GBMeth3]|uniref:class I SAM-dependent methyltransferase n=1 Tax=Hyphomicrobium sp. CS1GBMeth3 TaxID=1892845 RepID=UPI0009308976|nr:class I SAM-dependent methyltransferase [Hyphomicrobium sp. CS1GBMeth3]